jgi:hypothetical protein
MLALSYRGHAIGSALQSIAGFDGGGRDGASMWVPATPHASTTPGREPTATFVSQRFA